MCTAILHRALTEDLLHATRVTLALAMLAGAAALDLRWRRIPNAYWFPFLAAAAALLAVEAGTRGPSVLALAVAAALMLLAYGAWRLRLFGGADAKAIMVLAALAPDLSGDRLPTPFALDAVMNGALAAAAFPLAILAWNAARGDLRFPAALLGHRMPIARARDAHVWPMQRVGDDGRIHWRYGRLLGLDTDPVYDRLLAAGHSRVWVTAKLPFAAFVALGAALAVAVGNLPLRAAELAVGAP